MVCGDGPATYDARGIGAEIDGKVFTTEARLEPACSGKHRLTFERVGP